LIRSNAQDSIPSFPSAKVTLSSFHSQEKANKLHACITPTPSQRFPPPKSTTLLLALSKLPLTPLLELLLLPLRFRLASSGSVGCKPVARANRFRISVKLTTPERRPDMCWPGRAEAETEGVVLRGWKGGLAWGLVVVRCGGWATGGWEREMGMGPGVVGAEGVGVDDGVGVSTTHILVVLLVIALDRGSKRDFNMGRPTYELA